MINNDPSINGHAVKSEKPAYHDQLAFLYGVLAVVVLISAVPVEIILWKWAL